MAESGVKPRVGALIAMAHAADLKRSVDLMFARASAPVIASQQAVLFYLYSPNLVALREHLVANGVKVSPISYPDYMPKGEVRIDDPDGYCLLIGQAG